MSADKKATSITNLPLIFQPIESEMAEVENLINRKLSAADVAIRPIICNIMACRGKRLRPALLLLSAGCYGPIAAQHIGAAAAIELLHNATLMHDDVIDDAIYRRDAVSVNKACGVDAAVLTGDFLFAVFAELLAETQHPAARRVLAAAVCRMCAGELAQMSRRGSMDVSEDDYLSIAEGKTASLIAAACETGAVLSGSPVAAAHAEFGRNLGTAFQIIDDCLDLTGSECAAGKTLGSDLFKRRLTLPGIHLIAHAPSPCKTEAIRLLSASTTMADRDSVAALMAEHGSLDYALAHARRLVASAKAAIEMVQPGPCKAALLTLADYILKRGS